MKNNKLFMPVVVLIVILIGVYYLMQPSLKNENSRHNKDASTTQTDSISYAGRDGIDVLTLLKENAKIETQDFGSDLGEYVLSINGKGSENNYFWTYYVNNIKADSSASKYITKNSDKVEWRYEKFDF